jgi:hypothetical protein
MPVASLEPTRINADAVYTDVTASMALGISLSALDKGRRDGSLRFSRRAGKVLFLGSWLLQWIEAGEVRADRPEIASVAVGA